MKRASLFLCVGLCLSISALAQTRLADSLSAELKRNPQSDTVRINILNQLAFEQHFFDPSLALNFGVEAKNLSRELGYAKGEVLADRFIGLAFWVQANHSTALQFFLMGLHLADSIHFLQAQADLNGNVGLVYNGLGDYNKALTYFTSSLKQQRILKNKKREVVMLNNIGDSFLFKKVYDSALLYYGQSLSIGEGFNYMVETNKRNIGNVLEAQGKWEEALKLYEEARALADRRKDTREQSQVRKSIASLYLKKGNPDRAEAEAKNALIPAQRGHNRAVLRDTYELLYQIAKQKHQPERALECYQTYILYKDSIQNNVEAASVASMQMDFELKRKQAEIYSIQRINEEKINQKNFLIAFSAFAILLLLLLLFSAWRTYYTERRLNKELAEKNREINHQRLELVAQHDEVLSLNEEIRSQQEEVIAQRDALTERNQKIETLHERLLVANLNLEKLVEERTHSLTEQNRKLEEYAFLNAHKLRAPVANVLGLINILEMKHLADERSEILHHLKKSSWELDQVIRSIGNTIHEGITAFNPQNSHSETK